MTDQETEEKKSQPHHLKGKRKYDAETRRKVRKAIRRLSREGLGQTAIAERLNEEKVPTANGQPWTIALVNNQLGYIKRHLEKKRGLRPKTRRRRTTPDSGKTVSESSAPTPPLTLPVSVELMLDDDDLSDSQKIAIIRAVRDRRKQ